MDTNKLTTKSRDAVSTALRTALTSGNPNAEPSHLLHALLLIPGNTVAPLISAVGGDPAVVQAAAQGAISKLPTASGSSVSQPALSGSFSRVLADAENRAQQLGDAFVATEHLLISLAAVESDARKILRDLKITPDALTKAFNAARGNKRVTSAEAEGTASALDQYGVDLTAAARDGSVCVVNPARARVANNKKLFALLDDPRFAHLVEPREAEVIAATIPWTRILRRGRVTYGQWVVDLLDFVSDNRARLVLKPASEYGGHGVALGVETEQAEWDGIIERHAELGDFIVQEYVPVPEEMFPTVEKGHVQMRLKRFNINPFGIGGRYAGMITRISDRAVINVSAGGGLLPSVVGRHKRRLLGEDEFDAEEEASHGAHA